MPNYYFLVDNNNIVVDSQAQGENTGTNWIYSGAARIPLGYYYNADLKKCYVPCRYDNWTLDTTTWAWSAPKPKPLDGRNYIWNEAAQSWRASSDITTPMPYIMILPAYSIP